MTDSAGAPAPDAASRHLRFFFDTGSGSALWSDHDGPVDPTDLPITADLAADIDRLAERWNGVIDWGDPASPCPMSVDECSAFNADVDRAVRDLVRQLGDGWTVDVSVEPLVAEPDERAAYEADPTTWWRRRNEPSLRNFAAIAAEHARARRTQRLWWFKRRCRCWPCECHRADQRTRR